MVVELNFCINDVDDHLEADIMSYMFSLSHTHTCSFCLCFLCWQLKPEISNRDDAFVQFHSFRNALWENEIKWNAARKNLMSHH